MWKNISLVALFIAFMVLLVFYVMSTVNCGDNCLRCDHFACSKCVYGWYGTDCTKKCQGCEDTCDKQTGRCKQCQPAHFSDGCNKPCPMNCRVSFDGFRHCDRDSGRCQDGCVPGRWGHQCQKPCSGNCDQSACHQDGGTCLLVCTDGWYGQLCDERCTHNCRAGFDGHRHCDRDSGRCQDGCIPGRWGHQCQKLCTGNCDQSACHQDGGTCLLGCTDGWYGQLCDKDVHTTAVQVLMAIDTVTVTREDAKMGVSLVGGDISVRNSAPATVINLHVTRMEEHVFLAAPMDGMGSCVIKDVHTTAVQVLMAIDTVTVTREDAKMGVSLVGGDISVRNSAPATVINLHVTRMEERVFLAALMDGSGDCVINHVQKTVCGTDATLSRDTVVNASQGSLGRSVTNGVGIAWTIHAHTTICSPLLLVPGDV
ncbi:platelet endothelial aggregation receptor 1-like [Haliotis rubra]|uniref:platelet endothelial aggregation receptor 1-like n=1 Tax=Haliotis rubra TaxID=36100 RepID=UPI001EE55C0A|nr:platelet endothelial aggregation receptor 1-like [Haliotis rubra]